MGVAVVHVRLQGVGVHVADAVPEHDPRFVGDAFIVCGRTRPAAGAPPAFRVSGTSDVPALALEPVPVACRASALIFV